jgi:hypothetical protein
VSIGKMDWKTPIGETRVIQKEKHPTWYPPESVRKEHIANGDPIPAVVKSGPDNPLGDYAMRLAAGNGTYLIHGTNNPMAVGMAITHGCVRMYPEDVAALFPLIPVGTKVWLINEPVKVAFVDGELFLEAHPQVDEEGQNTSTEPDLNLLSDKLDQALGNTTAAIHWDFAKEALQAANGIPTVVGLQADPDTGPSADPAAGGTPPASTPAASTPPAAAPSSAGTAAHAPDDATKSTTAGTADTKKPAPSADSADAPNSAPATGNADVTKSTSSTGTADASKSAHSAAGAPDATAAASSASTADAPKSASPAAGTADATKSESASASSADTSTKPVTSADATNSTNSTAADPSPAASDARSAAGASGATKAPSTPDAAASTSTTASDTPAADDPPTTILRPVLRPAAPGNAPVEPQPDSTAGRTASATPDH